MKTKKQPIDRNELDLAMMAIKATRRQVNADLDVIEARIRRALPGSTESNTRANSDPAYWRKRFKHHHK